MIILDMIAKDKNMNKIIIYATVFIQYFNGHLKLAQFPILYNFASGLHQIILNIMEELFKKLSS